MDQSDPAGEIWSDTSGPSVDEISVIFGTDYHYLAGRPFSILRHVSQIVFLYLFPLGFGFSAGTFYFLAGHPLMGAFGYFLGVFAAYSFSGMNRVRVFFSSRKLEKCRVFLGMFFFIQYYDLNEFDCVEYQLSAFQGKVSSCVVLVGREQRLTVIKFYDCNRSKEEVLADIKVFTSKLADAVALPICCLGNRGRSDSRR